MFRAPAVLLIGMLSGAFPEAGGDNKIDRISIESRRVRPMNPAAERLLADAALRSPTVAAQIDALERSDLIVMVFVSPFLARRTGQTAFLAASGGARFIRVDIFGLNHYSAQIEWLGHELQHALEIAGEPEIRSSASLEAFYRRVGMTAYAGSTNFETMAAIEAGQQVRLEVAAAAEH
jgi:hypothetical protein